MSYEQGLPISEVAATGKTSAAFGEQHIVQPIILLFSHQLAHLVQSSPHFKVTNSNRLALYSLAFVKGCERVKK